MAWLDTRSAAKEFKRTPDHLALLARQGKIKAEFINGRWLINTESLLYHLLAAARRKEGRKEHLSKQFKRAWKK